MKNFICLVAIIGSIPVFATEMDPAEPCAKCPTGKVSGHQMSGELDQIEKLAKNIKKTQSKEMEALANRLCSQLIRSEATAKLSGSMAFKRTIAEYLDIDVDAKDTREKIIDFWNLKKDQLICTNKSSLYASPQPVMRRIIDMRIQEDVFFEFLLEDENDEYEGKVDINIVHVNSNGESTTVLDYIHGICRDKVKALKYDCDELKDLQDSLQNEYGGKYVKYAKEFPGYAHLLQE